MKTEEQPERSRGQAGAVAGLCFLGLFGVVGVAAIAQHLERAGGVAWAAAATDMGGTNSFTPGRIDIDYGAAANTSSIFIGHRGSGPLVVIRADGTVEIQKGVTLNAATRTFWKAVETSNPLRGEVSRLRDELAACRSTK